MWDKWNWDDCQHKGASRKPRALVRAMIEPASSYIHTFYIQTQALFLCLELCQLSPFFTVSHRGEFPSATNRKYKSWEKMIVLPNFAALSWCLQRHYQQHRLQLRFVLILQSISPKVLLLHFLRWIHHGFVREKSNFLEIWEIIDRYNCIIVGLIL